LNVANKMADKKKNSSQRSTRNQSQALASKARSDEMVEPKARSDEKEQSKQVKTIARERDGRKAQESKPMRRESKSQSQSKGPPSWQVRLRSNRYFQFVLDAYYELRHKVTWPSFNEARNMTIAVILLSLAVGLVLFVADYGLQNLYTLLVH
jgi:preprotein translocase SecE subunit